MWAGIDTHEQLLSLGEIVLDGHPLAFCRATIHLVGDQTGAWRCSLRGLSSGELDESAGELRLQGQTLDGRQIEGQVLVAQGESQGEKGTETAELAGLGYLLVDGRRL